MYVKLASGDNTGVYDHEVGPRVNVKPRNERHACVGGEGEGKGKGRALSGAHKARLAMLHEYSRRDKDDAKSLAPHALSTPGPCISATGLSRRPGCSPWSRVTLPVKRLQDDNPWLMPQVYTIMALLTSHLHLGHQRAKVNSTRDEPELRCESGTGCMLLMVL
ncbi:hypothetical protein C0Q70_05945 [Pomacea canaliculata]|uniref:Uncharacterized protein n=1 Tax=Pomacea canaliculata TaxID=400727 RepID=A0A2T7PMK3_POMCA|nr:hypothetical protein C0Q70_05945 [Pomacea canaliculata]